MLFSKEIEDPFSHGGWIAADRAIPWLMGSYHPSRQNTQTKRLTEKMFDGIWEKVDFVINGEKP
jgi:uracil-DNA glycosylase